MARGTVNRQVQIGVETTPGTAVPANKSLPSLNLTLTRELETKSFRSQGYKPNTARQIIKDFGSGTMSGPLNYTEIIYPLNSLVTGVITTPATGTASRDHTFTPAAIGADAFKSFTIQEGDTVAARQMANCVFSEFGLTSNLTTAEISGKMFGTTPTSGSLTGSPTSIALLPVNLREISVYMDTSFATIGTTKLAAAEASSFQITNKYALQWVLNSTYASFKDVVETPPTLTFSFTTEDDAQSRTLFDSLSANPTKYMRFEALGSIIETTIKYKFQLNVGCQISGSAQEDVDGVWSYRYDAEPIYTSTFPGGWSAVVTNTLTAL